MAGFYLTPQLKARRQKMRVELGMLKMKEKLLGGLSEKDEKRRREIMLELSKHY